MKRSRIIRELEQAPLVEAAPESEAEDTSAQPGSGEAMEQAGQESTNAAGPRVPAPRIKTVAVQYGRKLNLGDFNSAEISLTLWADLDEDEDAQAALDLLYAQAKDNVKKQALPLLKAEPVSLNYRETFLGMPVNGKKEQEK
jgi:hypothetical protein